MIKICALFSGSSGNSIFITNNCTDETISNSNLHSVPHKGGGILVDAGMSGKQMQIAMSSIDESLENISGLLITHEHIDHMRGAGVIVRRYKIPLYVNELTWVKMQKMQIGIIPDDLVNIIDNTSDFAIGDYIISSIKTPHDAADSYGYKITSGNRTVSVLTDIGEMSMEMLSEIENSDAVFIESNYDKKMLWEGSYPYMLKKRIDGNFGHLSNEDCARSIIHLLNKGTERFILSHLSQENNLPSVALRETKKSLENIGSVIDRDVLVQVAKRSCASVPWSF